ncbi:hypothetical protein Tco_1137713 [Tanacetum coccineum]
MKAYSKHIDWGQLKITKDIMEGYVMLKYGKTNWREDDSWADIILDDVYDTFYRDEEQKTEVAKESEDMTLSIMKGGDVDEIEFLLHHDPSTPKISVASILEGFTNEPPLEENDDLFDLESKENEWKKILYDALIDDLVPDIHETNFSPTYVRLPFEDRGYLSLTYVIRIVLPCFTYLVESSLPLSFGSEDIIFDPGISAFHFSSLEPVAYNCLMEVCSSTCFVPNITMIRGESI